MSRMDYGLPQFKPTTLAAVLLRKATEEECQQILKASKGGDNGLLQRLMAKSVDVVNARFVEWYNQTPLHLAAWGGHVDVAETLIQNGAEIDAKSEANSTPLNVASYHNKCGVVKLLLHYGANCNTIDWGYHTPLYWAARNGCVSITKELISVKADLEIVEMSRHWTPLHAASYHDSGDVVVELVRAGANLDAIDKDGRTPLHLAIEKSNAEIIQYFIREANVDASQLSEHLQLKIDSLLMKLPLQQNVHHDHVKHSDISMTLDIEKSLFSKMGHDELMRKAALSYEEALNSGERAANQFKLVLVGPEGAGKTSTVGSLLGKLFQPDQPTTIGTDLNKCTVDRILVSQWKETNVNEHLEGVTNQYNCEMKTCMSQVSRNSGFKLPLKAKPRPSYNHANLVRAKKVIESKLHGGSSRTKIIIYDLGGQEIYQIFRCLFLASEDIVFLVFNASIGLNGHVKNRQRQTRFKKKVETQGTLTNLQAIETILNSIFSHSTDTEGIQSISNRMPVVFLIATHSKNLSFDDKESIKCTIYEKFSGRPFMDHLPESKDDAIHFIDNADRDPKVFEDLKTVVIKAADCVTKKKRPISYLQFESEILKLSLTKTSITIPEASEIALKSGIKTDLKYTLHYFHHKGILQYYSQVESLRSQVFISPQEISDNVSTVISTHNCMPKSARLQRSCDRYEAFGLLEEDLFDNLLVNAGRLEKKDILLGLLENFNLVVELPLKTKFIDEDPSYSIPKSGRVFLIPAMLTYNKSKVYNKHINDIVILFHYPDKFLPEAIFNRVLIKTVIWSNSKGHEVRGIYHASGRFDFKDHRQCFVIQQCLVTFSVKCFIIIHQHLSSSKQQLEEMLTHRQELVKHLRQCISDVHESCIPSAQHPIAYLECPFKHEPDFPPHIPLDEISVFNDVLCRQSQNQRLPIQSYILLLKTSSYDDVHLPNVSVDASDTTCDSVMDLLYQLNPELNDYINMSSLIPYMNKHKVLTRKERFYLNDASKCPSDKVTYLLSYLEGKDPDTVNGFVKALKEEKEHSGHALLCSLLVQKGVKL